MKCKYIEGFTRDYNERKIQVVVEATKHEWEFLEEQQQQGMISFNKMIDNFMCRMNIYLTTMSVTTYVRHPKKGKGQLYRKSVDIKLLTKIFKNPRHHSGKGYYEKKKQKTLKKQGDCPGR